MKTMLLAVGTCLAMGTVGAAVQIESGLAEKVTVKEVKGHVRARAFVDDEYGRLRVLVACEGPGESEAEIEVEGEKTLLAKFANTVAERTKDGRTIYRFKGKGVDCDLLQRWPELEFNKDLNLPSGK